MVMQVGAKAAGDGLADLDRRQSDRATAPSTFAPSGEAATQRAALRSRNALT